MDQFICQSHCEANTSCVGISVSHAIDMNADCYLCLDDVMGAASNSFGFYRRPNIGVFSLPGGTVTDYLHYPDYFSWPDNEWTIFLHANIHETTEDRSIISFASSNDDNCLLVNSDFDIGWHYIRVTSSTTETKVYQDGVLRS
eukprot:UN05409